MILFRGLECLFFFSGALSLKQAFFFFFFFFAIYKRLPALSSNHPAYDAVMDPTTPDYADRLMPAYVRSYQTPDSPTGGVFYESPVTDDRLRVPAPSVNEPGFDEYDDFGPRDSGGGGSGGPGCCRADGCCWRGVVVARDAVIGPGLPFWKKMLLVLPYFLAACSPQSWVKLWIYQDYHVRW